MRLLCLLCKVFSTSRPTYICNLYPSMGNSHHHSNSLYTLVPNAPFFYSLKRSGNRKVLWCFLGIEKGWIGNVWVNTLSSRSEYFKNSFISNAANEWNKLNADICSSPSYNIPRNTLLKLQGLLKGRPLILIINTNTYNNNLDSIKLLTRLRLSFNHLGEHKFRDGFTDVLIILFVSIVMKQKSKVITFCLTIAFMQTGRLSWVIQNKITVLFLP